MATWSSYTGAVRRLVTTITAGLLAGSCVAGPVSGNVPSSLQPSPPRGVPSPAAATAAPLATLVLPMSPEPVVETAPCQIVPTALCDRARRTTLDNNGVRVEFLVLDLPPGTPITTPVAGLLAKGRESGNMNGFAGIVRGVPALIVSGDIEFDDMIQRSLVVGARIAVIGDTGTRIGKDARFNLALTMTRRTEAGPVVDQGILRVLFPKAFELAPVSIEQGPPGAPTVFVDYGPTPPGATATAGR